MKQSRGQKVEEATLNDVDYQMQMILNGVTFSELIDLCQEFFSTSHCR